MQDSGPDYLKHSPNSVEGSFRLRQQGTGKVSGSETELHLSIKHFRKLPGEYAKKNFLN